MCHQFMIFIRTSLARLKTGALCLALAACCDLTANDNDQTTGDVRPPGLSLIAGSIGGSGTRDAIGSAARFNFPVGIAVDGSGNLYVTDAQNHTIRKISPAGVVTTLAGVAGSAGSTNGVGAAARFFFPHGITIDGSGILYVADAYNHTIRKIVIATGMVSTLAGSAGITGGADGSGAAARFSFPHGITIDGSGILYVADSENNEIRKITSAGLVTTLAGAMGPSAAVDGTGAAARFAFPLRITADISGDLYVTDTSNHTIRKVTAAGVVTTWAGAAGSAGSVDGAGIAARFHFPEGITSDGAGNLYVSDRLNQTIRMISPGAVVTTLAGAVGAEGSADGTSTARFRLPAGVVADAAGTVYVADTENHTIRKISPAGVVSTLAGAAPGIGSADGTGAAAQFYFPSGIASDGSGNLVVTDTTNNTIRRITPAGVVSTLAGTAGSAGSADGVGAAARFDTPSSIAADGFGNFYVADTSNHAIRKISPAGVVSTLAGMAGSTGNADGAGAAARFYFPNSIAADKSGDLYVADTGNHAIRKITAAGVVSTLAGTAGSSGSTDGIGAAARFNSPQGIAADGSGNLYVSDTFNHAIRRIVTATGAVSRLAGAPGSPGSADGIGAAARFNTPHGLTADGSGNVYVADTGNHTIRKLVVATGEVITVAGVAGQKGVVLGDLPGGLSSTFGVILIAPNTLAVTTENGVLRIILD